MEQRHFSEAPSPKSAGTFSKAAESTSLMISRRTLLLLAATHRNESDLFSHGLQLDAQFINMPLCSCQRWDFYISKQLDPVSPSLFLYLLLHMTSCPFSPSRKWVEAGEPWTSNDGTNGYKALSHLFLCLTSKGVLGAHRNVIGDILDSVNLHVRMRGDCSYQDLVNPA